MSETDLDREPIELIEFVLPKCANRFGCLPCKAGLGDVEEASGFTREFKDGIGSYKVINATATRVVGGIQIDATAVDPIFQWTGNATGYDGDDYRYIVIHGKLLAGTPNELDLRYGNLAGPGFPFTANQLMGPQNEDRPFRGVVASEMVAGDEFVLVFDAADSTDYATEYLGNTITDFRFDMGQGSDISYILYSFTVCSESLFDNRGAECYNTRATCSDVDNYRDTPDRHMTPDLVLANGDTVPFGDINRTTDMLSSFEVRFSSAPDGVIWEQGSVVRGSYFGVTSDELVWRAGDGAASPAASAAGMIRVDALQFAGKSMIFYPHIRFTASGTSYIYLWVFDPVELTLTLLGEDTWTAAPEWAGSNDGGIGKIVSSVVAGESTADWNGGITVARIYETTSPDLMEDNFRSNLWLGEGVKGEPTDEQYILTCLGQLSTVSTKINLNAADDNYQPLGRRASIDFAAGDFTHSGVGQDPYRTDRLHDPREKSSFWRKWLVRQKFGKVGALVRRHTGYAKQALSDYLTQSFVLEQVKWNEDGLSFYCRDVLTRTEFRKAQIPPPSAGTLDAELLAADVTFYIAGDVTGDYPASGTVRINDEIITYTATAYDAADEQTDFTGLTRGTDGSTADDHDIDDLVQECRRLTDAALDDTVIEWLVDDAGLEGQLINIEEIEDEHAAYLDAYILNGLITEPTGVDELLGKLSQECSFYIWWDERAQQVRMKAIRATDGPDIVAAWTDADNIIGGTMSLTEKPKQRLNIISFYYNPIDFAGELNKPSNYHNGLLVVNGTTSLPEQYGNYVQTQDIFSWFLATEAQANQTASRLAIRYADVPVFAKFMVDAKDREVWVGDVVTLDTPEIVDRDGNNEIRRWLVVEADEPDPGHIAEYVCADITLDGRIYFITENSVTEYTPELFAEANGFITDNNGLNPDGTNGARIS